MGEIKRMSVQHITGYAFAAKGGSNHYMVIDSEYQNQPAAANSPMELVLAALGSCTASDVVEILLKKRLRVDRFVVQLSGEREEDHPRVYKKIHMHYQIYGKRLTRKAVEHAIELSLSKYCSVHSMLSKSVEITHEYTLHESTE
ncbi:MAG TPA: OsmC family protein [Bacteroidota bacterium]|nr:OsmC family protein [Bacteroidota bacterium]